MSSGDPPTSTVPRISRSVGVDLDDGPGALGGHHQVAAIGREVEMVDARPGDLHELDELPGLAIIEVEAVVGDHVDAEVVGHDDRLRPIGREVGVVRERDLHRLARLLGLGVDDRQGGAVHVADVQLREVPVRRDVLRRGAGREAADDLEGLRVDDGDVVRRLVRHVHPRRQIRHARIEHPARRSGIDPANGRFARARLASVGRWRSALSAAARSPSGRADARRPATDADAPATRRTWNRRRAWRLRGAARRACGGESLARV